MNTSLYKTKFLVRFVCKNVMTLLALGFCRHKSLGPGQKYSHTSLHAIEGIFVSQVTQKGAHFLRGTNRVNNRVQGQEVRGLEEVGGGGTLRGFSFITIQ